MRTCFLNVALIQILIVIGSNTFGSSMLPLSITNAWEYEFTDQSPGALSSREIETLRFDDVQVVGDFCMPPLVFGDERLVLYLSNENEVLVLYGFRAIINQREVEFFFHSGDEPSVYSGVVLSGFEDNVLLEDQKGKQQRIINNQEVTLEWEARVKGITRETLEGSGYTGQIASAPRTVDEGELYSFEFYLFIGPCQVEGGCNAGIFSFTFLADVGLAEVHLRGDHPEFGGQFDHVHRLLAAPEMAFDLVSDENEIIYSSCLTVDKDNLKRPSLGEIANWFNILLLVVVVLRGFKVLTLAFFRVYLQSVR